MQSPEAHRNTSYSPLGERRGKSDLACFSLDQSWARTASDSARARAYPSPPMSGSPPLPPRRILDPSDRGHGSYGPGGQDIFRGTQTPQTEHMEHRESTMRGYMPYPGAYRPEQMVAGQVQFQQALPPPSVQQPPPQQYHSGCGYTQLSQMPHPFSGGPDRQLIREAPEFQSSKQQRKTKGHVASACVPCKRAHLRCDAQRPCSRCLSNGKEDTCIDVQHKKRGRPRLRDERDSRYEGASYPPPADASMRRPLSMYASTDPSLFADTLPRSGSYRVLKSQAGPLGSVGSMGQRFMDYTSATDANMYGAPLPPAPRMAPSFEPPCAYLTMELQFARTTQSFRETIGVHSFQARKLQDVVSASERDKVARLQRSFEDERREREPNYLPPIYLARFEEDHATQSIGFSPDDLGGTRTDRQEMFTFQAPDGQQRTFQVRLGLAKRDSTYFIVLLLVVPPATPQTFHQPSSSPYSREPYSRDPQYGHQTPQQSCQPAHGASSASSNPGFGDRVEMTGYRVPGLSGPGNPSSAGVTSFAPAQPRSEYPPGPGPYQAPRSELPPTPVPTLSQRPHDLQLPPIRDQRGKAPSPADPMRRDDRTGRVDIGGLLGQPGPASRGY
ncbi:c6 zinc finger domain containing protein [Diplocarpon rosae]|nr:c6 zinc finger domain containing protein [Diplocarpon rosae]